jgi:hypothetical protein
MLELAQKMLIEIQSLDKDKEERLAMINWIIDYLKDLYISIDIE